MTILQSIILGVIQGITEFLPISSSGHLVIFESLFGLQVEALRSFDVVVHTGTLLAILIYFRNDILDIFKQLFRRDFKMTGFLVVATIPAVIVGFTYKEQIDSYSRDPIKVAYAMIGAAAFFVIAEYIGRRKQKAEMQEKYMLTTDKASVTKLAPHELEVTAKKLSWGGVILIGIFQSIALIAGVSRSGSTISAGLIAGMNREVAARFSFLLGSIAIFGAGLLTAKDVISDGLYFPGMGVAIAGFIASFFAGYISVAFLMKFLKNHSLHVFAIYLVILASLVLLL